MYVIVRKFGNRFFALDVWGRWNTYTKPDVIRFPNVGAALRCLSRIGTSDATVHRID